MEAEAFVPAEHSLTIPSRQENSEARRGLGSGQWQAWAACTPQVGEENLPLPFPTMHTHHLPACLPPGWW